MNQDIVIKRLSFSLYQITPITWLNNKLIFYMERETLSRLNLNDDQIDLLAHRLDWNIMSSKNLSYRIIKTHYNKINWPIYIQNKYRKTIEILDLIHDEIYDNAELFGDPNIKRQYYSTYFITNFNDLIDWNWCLAKCILPDIVLLKYWHILDIYQVCRYQKLSLNILRAKKYELKWDILSCKILEEDIVSEFKDIVNWYNVCIHQKLSIDFIESHLIYLKYIDKCSSILPQYQTLSETFIHNHIMFLNMSAVCLYQKLSLQFIKEHAKYIDFEQLLLNKHYNCEGSVQIFKAVYKVNNNPVYYVIDGDQTYLYKNT
jgi:hypothetical protein